MSDYIVCPLCNKKLKSLAMHLRYKHNMTKEDFLKLYPGWDIFQIPNLLNQEGYICEICGKRFNTPASLGTHKTYIHGHCKYGTHNIADEKNKKEEGVECLICHKVYTNIKQHVELTHKITWDEYCCKYSYNGTAKYVYEKTRKLLSQNKKDFYLSERGEIWKRNNGIRVAGDKNPAKRKDIREKISKSRIKNKNKGFQGYGIRIYFNYNGREFKCRSFNEFKAIVLLLMNNIQFDYEKLNIFYNYKNAIHLHITDILVGRNIYEIKAASNRAIELNRFKDSEKYNVIRNICQQQGYKYKVVNIDLLSKELNIDKRNEKYFKDIIFNFLKEGIIYRIIVNRAKETYNTFIENDERLTDFIKEGIITITRY